MFADRKSCVVFVATTILTISACSQPIRTRHATDGSTSSDSAGGHDQAAEAQSALPDTPVVTADTQPEQARDSAVIDSKDAGPDVLMVRADGREIAADAVSPASLTVSPASLAFGSVALGFSSVRTLTITNLGQAWTGSVTIGSNGDFSTLASKEGDCLSARSLASGASCTVGVVFSPSVLGDRSGRFTFSAFSAGSGSAGLTGSGVTGTLSFLAGAPSGIGSADGTGAAARFKGPTDVALDGSGNLFVSDTENHTVRKITPAGVVSTLAGTPGVSGSVDGTGAAARFSYLHGIGVDKAGNVYVDDSNNCTIRKISPTGVVTTLAGSAEQPGIVDGTGAAARLDGPGAMVVDASDNLFIVDGAIVIRKVTPTGVLTTLAGTPGKSGSVDGMGAAARFNAMAAMTMDGEGNLLAVEKDGTIRKITPTGVVTTVSRSGGTEIRGVGIDSAGNIFTADYTDNVIRKITSAGVVTIWAGTFRSVGGADGAGLAARFAGPSGMTVDPAGNLFVADSVNCAIRKITPAGVVTTLAGALGSSGKEDGTGADAAFFYPTGVAVDGAGNVFISQDTSIRKITPAGLVTTFAGSPDYNGYRDGQAADARFFVTAGMEVDGAGNLVVAERGSRTIRKITPAGVVTTLAGEVGVSGSEDGVGSAAHFDWPSDVAIDGAGNIFVTDPPNRTIRKVTPEGVVGTMAGMAGISGTKDATGSAARFVSPMGIAIDGSGNLVVTDSQSFTIRKITPAGVVTTLAGNAGSLGSVDGQGTAARFATPTGVAVDGAGNAFVTDCDNNAVRRVTPAGVVTTVVGVLSPISMGEMPGPLPASLVCPVGVAFNPAGHLIIMGRSAVMLVSW